MVANLGIGASGLSAYRKLLETVGGNITNATTEGYVRRDVQLSVTGDSQMSPTSAPSTSGSGVVVDTVRRASDAFLQTQALKANSLNMQSQTLADSLAQLERTLFATSSNPGSVVQDFYNRFNDVANAPTSAAARISVIDSGKQVANMFAQTAASIQDSLDSARAGLDAALTGINSITSQLGRLNVQIQSASTGDQKPNDLLDQRDKLLTNLSNLANFNYAEQTNGSVIVYLGDTASGRPIVTADGSHPLGIVESGDKLEIALDPYSAPAPTNQLTSGTVAGLMDFRSQAKSLLDDINRLAVGFSLAVNEQHVQGVDLNGSQGRALFSTDGLTATGSRTNLGDAKLLLSIDSAASLSNATYTVTYNDANDTWTVKSSEGGTVTGQNNLSMGGVTFKFDGVAHDRDTFTVSPLFGAASSMRFLAKSPDEVAVALPLYVDPSPANQGNAELLPLRRTDRDPGPAIPSATDVFSGATDEVGFKNNGPAFFLPAGATSATISSLGTFSAIHFEATGSEIAALTNAVSGTQSLKLKINVDGNPQNPVDLTLAGANLTDIANAINAAANGAGHGDEYFASVTNGVLTINALGTHTISNASIQGQSSAITGVQNPNNEIGSSPAQIRIFTREGRQLSGPPLTADEIASYITTANGFLPEAKYMPPDDTTGYPGINISTVPPIMRSVSDDTNTNATIDVWTESSFNIPHAGYGDAPQPGAVYALDVDGLAPVRVAGDALAGAGPADIAATLADGLNAQAGRYAWLGGQITINDSMPLTMSFNVSIDDGPAQTVTFHRAEGKATGTFDVSDGSNLQVSLVDGSRVMLTIPPKLRTSAPTIAITGAASDLATLQLDSGNITTTLTSPIKITGTPNTTLTIKKDSSANPDQININSLQGSQNGITWNVVDGTLTLSSSEAFKIVSEDASQKAAASALGFKGADLDLTIESTIASADKLTRSLLVGGTPRLQVKGDSIGTQTLTLNGTNGTYNGITWSVSSTGALKLTSYDPTMRVDAGTPTTQAYANALGFTGSEPAGRTLTATNLLVESLLGANQGKQITVTSRAGGDKTFMINGLTGHDSISGVSWSYDQQSDRLVLSSANQDFQVKTSTVDTANAAQVLGFRGAQYDDALQGARIALTSAISGGLSVSTLATVSRVGQSVKIKGPTTEDLIVALTNTAAGSKLTPNNEAKLVSADIQIAETTDALPPPQDLQIRIVDSKTLKIFDPTTGVCLADRTWQPDIPVTYQGMSFSIHGNVKTDDIFTIRNDGSRSSDNRNALRMADLALTAIFGKGQGSFQDVYAGVTAKLGSSVEATTNSATAAAQAASDLKSAYEAKTGVNLDREAADLIRFQQAYQAAAQVIMVARDMFSTILKTF